MIMDTIQVELESHTKSANVVKELVLQQLLNDEKISKEVAIEYGIDWNIIIIKPTWYEKWFSKVGNSGPGWSYKFLKF